MIGAVGGGQDGVRLADAFTQAVLPPGTNALLLTGPFMPSRIRQRILRRARCNPRLRVLEFVREPAVLLSKPIVWWRWADTARRARSCLSGNTRSSCRACVPGESSSFAPSG